jgi:hypothetical protein
MEVQFGDPNGNHVGPDLGSMVSAASANLGDDAPGGVDLTCERTVNASIEYRPSASGDRKGNVLEVFVSYTPQASSCGGRSSARARPWRARARSSERGRTASASKRLAQWRRRRSW